MNCLITFFPVFSQSFKYHLEALSVSHRFTSCGTPCFKFGFPFPCIVGIKRVLLQILSIRLLVLDFSKLDFEPVFLILFYRLQYFLNYFFLSTFLLGAEMIIPIPPILQQHFYKDCIPCNLYFTFPAVLRIRFLSPSVFRSS